MIKSSLITNRIDLTSQVELLNWLTDQPLSITTKDNLPIPRANHVLYTGTQPELLKCSFIKILVLSKGTIDHNKFLDQQISDTRTIDVSLNT